MAKSKQPQKEAKPLFELKYTLTREEARLGLKILERRRDPKRNSRIIIGVLLVLGMGVVPFFAGSRFWWFPLLLWCLAAAVYLFYYWVRPARKREWVVKQVAGNPVSYSLSFFPKGMRVVEGEQIYRIFYEKTRAIAAKEMLLFVTPELMLMAPARYFTREQLEKLFALLTFSPEDQAALTREKPGEDRIPG